MNTKAYVVSPDGQRFLMSVVEETASPIAVILNWKGVKYWSRLLREGVNDRHGHP